MKRLFFRGEFIGGADPVSMIEVIPEVERKFSTTYSQLEVLKAADITDRIMDFNDIEFQLSRFPLLLDAAKIEFTTVSLGKILAYSASEKDLYVEPSTLRRYDVYWMEFPISLRDMENEGVGRVIFNVVLPGHSIALALIPLRYGLSMAVTERRSSPEVMVGAKGTTITVGEFYGRMVEYTLLKPVVVATGIRENKFSWYLTEEAVSTGSYLFVAIVGVPKGLGRLPLGVSVQAELDAFWGFQGDIAGTGVLFEEIELGVP